MRGCLYLLQAIKDGVIEATVDHQNGYVQSKVSHCLLNST